MTVAMAGTLGGEDMGDLEPAILYLRSCLLHSLTHVERRTSNILFHIYLLCIRNLYVHSDDTE